jgi:hypothetical protein
VMLVAVIMGMVEVNVAMVCNVALRRWGDDHY